MGSGNGTGVPHYTQAGAHAIGVGVAELSTFFGGWVVWESTIEILVSKAKTANASVDVA